MSENNSGAGEPSKPSGEPATAGHRSEGAEELHQRLDRIEGMLVSWRAPEGEAPIEPAWRRATEGEQRWAVTVAILVAVGLQLFLPARLTIHPHWMLPALELALLVALAGLNPHRRVDHASRSLRALSLCLVAAMSLANGWSAVKLVRELLHASGTAAPALLGTGGAIWATNVIAFALWYWEWDRGGPAARARGDKNYPDFLFPQMQAHELAPARWEPTFLDYLYVAFTNATAFSPTDTMPLSVWAKMLMMFQTVVSLMIVVLVVARAVNILQ
ncbi:hypothetical protein [Saccharothrix sp. ST-888]|uniref:hypothetical protein n=1 Tax=Saccharothrix sp. ST-888 TaxID=1427391 RepID=UPI001E30D433|nr:hypothetical protein [Saccharothrix sp. ST-888]